MDSQRPSSLHDASLRLPLYLPQINGNISSSSSPPLPPSILSLLSSPSSLFTSHPPSSVAALISFPSSPSSYNSLSPDPHDTPPTIHYIQRGRNIIGNSLSPLLPSPSTPSPFHIPIDISLSSSCPSVAPIHFTISCIAIEDEDEIDNNNDDNNNDNSANTTRDSDFIYIIRVMGLNGLYVNSIPLESSNVPHTLSSPSTLTIPCNDITHYTHTYLFVSRHTVNCQNKISSTLSSSSRHGSPTFPIPPLLDCLVFSPLCPKHLYLAATSSSLSSSSSSSSLPLHHTPSSSLPSAPWTENDRTRIQRALCVVGVEGMSDIKFFGKDSSSNLLEKKSHLQIYYFVMNFLLYCYDRMSKEDEMRGIRRGFGNNHSITHITRDMGWKEGVQGKEPLREECEYLLRVLWGHAMGWWGEERERRERAFEEKQRRKAMGREESKEGSGNGNQMRENDDDDGEDADDDVHDDFPFPTSPSHLVSLWRTTIPPTNPPLSTWTKFEGNYLSWTRRILSMSYLDSLVCISRSLQCDIMDFIPTSVTDFSHSWTPVSWWTRDHDRFLLYSINRMGHGKYEELRVAGMAIGKWRMQWREMKEKEMENEKDMGISNGNVKRDHKKSPSKSKPQVDRNGEELLPGVLDNLHHSSEDSIDVSVVYPHFPYPLPISKCGFLTTARVIKQGVGIRVMADNKAASKGRLRGGSGGGDGGGGGDEGLDDDAPLSKGVPPPPTSSSSVTGPHPWNISALPLSDDAVIDVLSPQYSIHFPLPESLTRRVQKLLEGTRAASKANQQGENLLVASQWVVNDVMKEGVELLRVKREREGEEERVRRMKEKEGEDRENEKRKREEESLRKSKETKEREIHENGNGVDDGTGKMKKIKTDLHHPSASSYADVDDDNDINMLSPAIPLLPTHLPPHASPFPLSLIITHSHIHRIYNHLMRNGLSHTDRHDRADRPYHYHSIIMDQVSRWIMQAEEEKLAGKTPAVSSSSSSLYSSPLAHFHYIQQNLPSLTYYLLDSVTTQLLSELTNPHHSPRYLPPSHHSALRERILLFSHLRDCALTMSTDLLTSIKSKFPPPHPSISPWFKQYKDDARLLLALDEYGFDNWNDIIAKTMIGERVRSKIKEEEDKAKVLREKFLTMEAASKKMIITTHIRSPYIPCQDGEGKTYYYHEITRETRWDDPLAGNLSVVEWLEALSPDGQIYYYEPQSNQTKWPSDRESEERKEKKRKVEELREEMEGQKRVLEKMKYSLLHKPSDLLSDEEKKALEMRAMLVIRLLARHHRKMLTSGMENYVDRVKLALYNVEGGGEGKEEEKTNNITNTNTTDAVSVPNSSLPFSINSISCISPSFSSLQSLFSCVLTSSSLNFFANHFAIQKSKISHSPLFIPVVINEKGNPYTPLVLAEGLCIREYGDIHQASILKDSPDCPPIVLCPGYHSHRTHQSVENPNVFSTYSCRIEGTAESLLYVVEELSAASSSSSSVLSRWQSSVSPAECWQNVHHSICHKLYPTGNPLLSSWLSHSLNGWERFGLREPEVQMTYRQWIGEEHQRGNVHVNSVYSMVEEKWGKEGTVRGIRWREPLSMGEWHRYNINWQQMK